MGDQLIYKYRLELTAEQTVDMPGSGEILSVQIQHGKLVMWVRCEKNHILKNRSFRIVGTGHEEVGFDDVYLDSVQMGEYVWHVFEYGSNHE